LEQGPSRFTLEFEQPEREEKQDGQARNHEGPGRLYVVWNKRSRLIKRED